MGISIIEYSFMLIVFFVGLLIFDSYRRIQEEKREIRKEKRLGLTTKNTALIGYDQQMSRTIKDIHVTMSQIVCITRRIDSYFRLKDKEYDNGTSSQ